MKTVLRFFGAIVLGGAFLFGITALYVVSFYNYESTGEYTCAVVFGAAVWPGGVASHALADRVHEAVDLYEEGRVTCMRFSGAPSVYGKHEVEVMRDVAHSRNAPNEAIELDFHGYNTQDTIANLPSDRSYLFISNDFHLARINLFARQLGISDYALHASEYRFGRYSRESYFLLREIGALWYYGLMPAQVFRG